MKSGIEPVLTVVSFFRWVLVGSLVFTAVVVVSLVKLAMRAVQVDI
jgi:hypothetical protein